VIIHRFSTTSLWLLFGEGETYYAVSGSRTAATSFINRLYSRFDVFAEKAENTDE
jgi:hypothetical protein